jgi:hypothetical protein
MISSFFLRVGAEAVAVVEQPDHSGCGLVLSAAWSAFFQPATSASLIEVKETPASIVWTLM